MAYREDEEKRIYELETAESLSAGTFVPVDKEGNEMAEKFDLGQLKADLETAINKNSGQLISLQYTDMEGWTLPDGITWRDVAERATCSTVNNSMVCQSAGFIQYPGSERFFQINYRGAVYSDSRSEYEDFLSVYLDPETYEVLNTVKGKRSDVVGILHDNDGSYSIEVLKNGEYVTGTDAYNWLNNYNIFSIITQTDRLFYPTGSTAYNQPLVYTSPIFSDGSYIIVKVKSDGSVEYEYKSKKVDAPSTAPEAGQVLTFNGTENTWANPPEGVYVINYSEVRDLNDIDVDRVKSQPTFMKIDTAEPLTISIPQYGGTSYTVPIQPGTIMGVEEIGPEGTVGSYTGPSFIVFSSCYGKATGGSIMQNADLKIMCVVSISSFGGVSKSFAANGLLNQDGGLFNSMPCPVTFKASNGRGGGEVTVAGNEDKNALQIEIQSNGNIRKQCLLPLDIQNHDFYEDRKPFVLDVMGWDTETNRAGYAHELLTSIDTVDNYPKQTASVQVNRVKLTDDPNPANDQIHGYIRATIRNSNGDSPRYAQGFLIPSPPSIGALQYWSDNNGVHMGFKRVNEVPTSASSDEGKVLTVDSNGAPVWQSQSSGGGTEIIRGLIYWGGSGYGIVLDKTYSQIETFLSEGKLVTSQVIYVEYTPTTDDIDTEFTKQNVPILVSDSAGVLRILNGVPTISVHFPAWMNYGLLDSQGHIRSMILYMSDFTIEVRESDNLVFYYPSELAHITIQQDYPEDFYQNLTWSDFKILMGVYIASGKYPSIYLDDDSTNTPYVVVNYSGIDNATNGHHRFTGSQVNPQLNRLEIYQLEFFPETVDNVEKCKYQITTHYLALT